MTTHKVKLDSTNPVSENFYPNRNIGENYWVIKEVQYEGIIRATYKDIANRKDSFLLYRNAHDKIWKFPLEFGAIIFELEEKVGPCSFTLIFLSHEEIPGK